MPEIREAQRASAEVLKVYPRCELMTPIAWRMALRESRLKTAGCVIHSRLDSSSESRAIVVAGSMPAAGVNGFGGSFRGGDGVLPGSGRGMLASVGEPLASPTFGVGGRALFGAVPDGGGGRGGRPPLLSPFRIERVSPRRWLARWVVAQVLQLLCGAAMCATEVSFAQLS